MLRYRFSDTFVPVDFTLLYGVPSGLLIVHESLAANHCENSTKTRQAILLRENVANSQ